MQEILGQAVKLHDADLLRRTEENRAYMLRLSRENLMLNYKNRIDQLASMLTSNVRAANSIYPTTLHEYEQRRDYQNTAIVNVRRFFQIL